MWFKRGEEGKFGRGFQNIHEKYISEKIDRDNFFLLNMLNSYLGKVKNLSVSSSNGFCAMLKKTERGSV